MAASSACLLGHGSSASTSKTILKEKLFHRHLFATQGRSVLLKSPKSFTVKASSDKAHNDGRRGFLKLLLGNAGVASTLVSSRNVYADDEQGVSSSRMSYSRFLEERPCWLRLLLGKLVFHFSPFPGQNLLKCLLVWSFTSA